MTSTDSKVSARFFLGLVALFLGEQRDGLTMINMQSAYLIISKLYTEKQAGILFFVFGMSQFIFQTPAGYIMDSSNHKLAWLAGVSIITTALTLLTAATAQENGNNLGWMIFIKVVQGGVTAMIPPGLNSITQGIVGGDGMTRQVSDNEMRNHSGTAIIVLSGSLIAYFMYPDIGILFIVSPIACAGVLLFLFKINPKDIDHDMARGLAKKELSEEFLCGTDYICAKEDGTVNCQMDNKAVSVLSLLSDTTLLIFTIIVFLFHASNATVLPLVMQTLAIGEGRVGILLSGLAIIVSQIFMVATAKVCGDYSELHGRKILFLVGLFSLPIRCVILVVLTELKNAQDDTSIFLQVLILSTQILDGVGAGVFGTMYILVTSDISAGTGRFSLTLGLTTAAMSIGGTFSGYLGQALAEDLGYQKAFSILGFMALAPAIGYLMFMPETLGMNNNDANNTSKDETKIPKTPVMSMNIETEMSATNEEKRVV